MTPDYTPFEAGLGGRVHFKRKNEFLGREALARQTAVGPPRRLCRFTSEERLAVSGGETLLRGGEVVGLVSSAGYGSSVQRTILYGYLPAALAGEEAFEIEAFGERHPVQRAAPVLYDPANERLKS